MKTTLINNLFNGLNDSDRLWISNPHLHETELLYIVRRAKEELSKLSEKEISHTNIRLLSEEE